MPKFIVKALKSFKTLVSPLFSRHSWRSLRDYVGAGKQKKSRKISDHGGLIAFIDGRSSHVAQTSLYGYLRTRAGTRFPELFENPDILQSINMAKWHIWLACVSDLCVFVGRLFYQSNRLDSATISTLMSKSIDQILKDTGVPEEAGEDFQMAIKKAEQRIHTCDWSKNLDDDTIFSQSPEALFYWAPIADELKNRDEEIVRNSVRFRWIEVRRDTRRLLDIETLAIELAATRTEDNKAGLEASANR